ncbi:hypothetical protein KDH_59480 [Dictyobacter sp. S3.2.2.5]|uniref:N-acetyltransferase domain-containing protein n=1 Tax=Dictyobacter halimunensis TaxID=3026934 RepID=A0ABQ6FXU7_9CHLR|nr:hypothetical protein KDH_59480 [Dictyobacter sp. S3.2.2.5]
MPPLLDWHLTQDTSNDQAYAILAQDRVMNCFSLADLEPPMREYSQFALACQEEGDERAICLILRHPSIGEVISPFGSREGMAAIMQQLTMPEHPTIQAQELHMPVLQRYYQPETTWRGMLRMAVTPSSIRSPLSMPLQPIKQLTVSDLPALESLYAQHPESVFSADLFTQGLYFGAYAGDRIIAAGGTHALVPAHRIAVLGNILTAPEARGQGYATAITAALVETLFEQRFSLVVLNVYEDNTPAISIYQRLGFQTHHRLLTGQAHLSRREA